MEPKSNVICDSNICIFRTLANVEPKIYIDLLTKTQKFLNDITNTGMECKLIITDTIKTELLNKNDNSYILIKSIQNFCKEKLHWSPYDYRIQKITRNAEKSIIKFVDKKHISKVLLDFDVDYEKELKDINDFYLKYPKKLSEITQKKLSSKSDKEKQWKISQRPNDLPEEPDRKILAETLELKRNFPKVDNCILTNDSDFIEFTNEIRSKFEIQISEVH